MSANSNRAVGFAAAADPIAYLRSNSGLPGPRGNLELLQAAVDVADETAYRAWIAAGTGGPADAGAGTTAGAGTGAPAESGAGTTAGASVEAGASGWTGAAAAVAADRTDEYLVACGVVGLGRLAAGGRADVIAELRHHAADRRWRVREAVAMALQQIGDADVDAMLAIADDWAADRAYVQRAAIAGVSEPRLLRDPSAARRAVELVDRLTGGFAAAADGRSDEARTLRQALGYCWSVVVAADFEHGRPAIERWASSDQADITWIVRENLGKKRLRAIDPAWADALAARLSLRHADASGRTLARS